MALPLLLRAVPACRGYQYTGWIVAAVVAAMVYPRAFLTFGDFNLRNKWLILFAVQAVMFGMGTQMSLRDFAGVIKMPWGVLVAVAGQFTIMPLVGWALTRIFPLPDEIAAGVILIGAILVTGTADSTGALVVGLAAVVLATLNMVGGFVVTDRMLEMFSGKKRQAARAEGEEST